MSDPKADFAAMMSGAATVADSDVDAEAPYGRKADGTPKKTRGRPKNTEKVEAPVVEPLVDSGDPEPAWQEPDSSDPKPLPDADDVKAAKENLSAFCGMLMLLSGPVITRDPICGNALFGNLENIVDSATPLILKSEAMVKWFSGGTGGDWMLWINLLMACAPVLTAIAQHHIFKRIAVQYDEAGNAFQVDAHQHEPQDYSMYSTDA